MDPLVPAICSDPGKLALLQWLWGIGFVAGLTYLLREWVQYANKIEQANLAKAHQEDQLRRTRDEVCPLHHVDRASCEDKH